MDIVFDIGMYDGADTAYYLQSGYRIVAVEANPELVQHAIEVRHWDGVGTTDMRQRGDLDESWPFELVLSGADPDSSSVFGDRVAHRRPVGSITVPGITMQDMLSGYGATPFYVKVDIEGRIGPAHALFPALLWKGFLK